MADNVVLQFSIYSELIEKHSKSLKKIGIVCQRVKQGELLLPNRRVDYSFQWVA